MTHHVIYVPGLGDYKAQGQQLLPGYWRLFGVQGHYCAINWRQGSFGPKLNKLIEYIDALAATGDRVSLVGTSAGASAVLLAYADRLDKVHRMAIICGKVQHPETIERHTYAENPAFKESLALLQRTLPKLDPAARSRILSIHPLRDNSVPPADTFIEGAQQATMPTAGHAFSIAFTLLFYAPWMIGFLKRT